VLRPVIPKYVLEIRGLVKIVLGCCIVYALESVPFYILLPFMVNTDSHICHSNLHTMGYFFKCVSALPRSLTFL